MRVEEMLCSTLKARLKKGALRTLKTREGLIDFASNDYLGLARSPLFCEKTFELFGKRQAKIACKMGSSGSRLLSGHHSYFSELEEKIARFHGFEAGLLCNSGYTANLALIASLAQLPCRWTVDRSIHASMHDGLRLGHLRPTFFRHNDLDQLEERLTRESGPSFVLVEAVYSTDGSLAPLKEIAELCTRYGARLIVDEAHSIGVFGQKGRGRVAEEGLGKQVFAIVVTFGKALGCHGAILLGSSLMKQYLINFARPFLYTTAMPLWLLCSIEASYALFPNMEAERSHVQALMQLCPCARSPIQPIPMAGLRRAKLASHALSAHGYDVRALFHPTVSRGQEILRLCLHAHNTAEELKHCLSIIQQWRAA